MKIGLKKLLLISVSATMMLCAKQVLGHDVELDTKMKRISYAIGINTATGMAQELLQLNVDIDPDAVAQGIIDIFSGSDLRMTNEEMTATLTEFQEMVIQQQEEASKQNMEQGEKFMQQFGEQEGVVTTESGLMYRVMIEGTGKKPTATDTVVVHYRGSLVNGRIFDDSQQRGEPATFSLSGIIPGWQEVLQLMTEGSTWEVVIPSNLAYGERGAPPSIPPNSALVFTIELIEVQQ